MEWRKNKGVGGGELPPRTHVCPVISSFLRFLQFHETLRSRLKQKNKRKHEIERGKERGGTKK